MFALAKALFAATSAAVAPPAAPANSPAPPSKFIPPNKLAPNPANSIGLKSFAKSPIKLPKPPSFW